MLIVTFNLAPSKHLQILRPGTHVPTCPPLATPLRVRAVPDLTFFLGFSVCLDHI